MHIPPQNLQNMSHLLDLSIHTTYTYLTKFDVDISKAYNPPSPPKHKHPPKCKQDRERTLNDNMQMQKNVRLKRKG